MSVIVSAPQGKPRAAVPISACVAVLLLLFAASYRAQAVPSFARQTGAACAQCHVIGFGPALTEYGRQFKLNGYTWKADDGSLKIPLSLTAVGGYSHTSKDLPNPPAPDFSTNDNWVVQTTNLYIAGRISEHLGVFSLATYDDTINNTAWGNLDIRYARTLQIGGRSVVGGVSVNNNPTVEDLWSSTPVWGFPYVVSQLVPNPSAAPRIFGRLGQSVLGASLYSMIDGRFYLALGLYRGLSNTWLDNLGMDSSGSPEFDGVIPYIRAAYQRQFASHYLEIGALGMNVKERPAGLATSDTDRYTDYGIDATYQFVAGAHSIDTHFAWVHEDRTLDASFAAHRSSAIDNELDSTRLNATYAYRQTWIGSVGLFNINGSSNPALFAPGPGGGSASGSPNSRGYTLQLEVVPFGKADSFGKPWLNVRTGVQYTGYWRFNGGDSNYDGFGRSASDNNTVFVFAWLGF
jgi:hypothetical protein